MKYLAISLCAHLTLMYALLISNSVEQQPPVPIQVQIIKTPAEPKMPPQNTQQPLHIGADGSSQDTLTLDQKLSADNYIDRLKGLIEPPWIMQVNQYLNSLKRSKRPIPNCQSCVQFAVNQHGDIVKHMLTRSCNVSKLDEIVINVSNRHVYPPPENIMQGSSLIIDWCFGVQ